MTFHIKIEYSLLRISVRAHLHDGSRHHVGHTNWQLNTKKAVAELPLKLVKQAAEHLTEQGAGLKDAVSRLEAEQALARRVLDTVPLAMFGLEAARKGLQQTQARFREFATQHLGEQNVSS